MAAGKKKTTRKKTTARKPARKKAAAKKKTTRKKAARKKATAKKKTAPKKAARKKTAGRKAPAGKTGQVAKPAKSAAPDAVSAEKTEEAKIAAAVPTRIGVVTHYFGRAGAAVISLETGELRVGDTIHVRGHTTDFYQRVNRIEIDHGPMEIARPGQSVGVAITQRVREHDEVFKVSD